MRSLIVIRNSTERPEAIDAGFAHLVQPGPRVGELGRRLITDPGVRDRREAILCPVADGLASERITHVPVVTPMEAYAKPSEAVPSAACLRRSESFLIIFMGSFA